jgi:hypothetical protein
MHSVPFLRRAVVGVTTAAVLAGAFYAGVAYAADPRLDQANDNIIKAIALLEAAENPDPKKEFGGHRKKAIELLRRAQSEVQKAKEFADRPPRDKDKDKDKGKGKGGHHGRH